MVDIQALVNKALEKGMTVWAEFDVVEGFEVEVAFVGREEMQKLYNKCTKRQYSRQTRRVEDVTNRDKLLKLWADRAIKSWKGLTLKKLQRLLPIELSSDIDPNSAVECTLENKVALLKHNAEFDDFVLAIATDSEVFMEHRKEAKQQVENLEQSQGG